MYQLIRSKGFHVIIISNKNPDAVYFFGQGAAGNFQPKGILPHFELIIMIYNLKQLHFRISKVNAFTDTEVIIKTVSPAKISSRISLSFYRGNELTNDEKYEENPFQIFQLLKKNKAMSFFEKKGSKAWNWDSLFLQPLVKP
jgi:hypothetical protein